ncbi:MAG: acetyl-CoA carboxylase biotin carboxyl carrier protein [Myxococcales bacterium]|nr:acetyl-CoA carboxylase biotin carboxyl carrier protein [Myxococcales bacterium]
MDIDLEQLRALIETINELGIDELELEAGDERICLRRGGLAAPQSAGALGFVDGAAFDTPGVGAARGPSSHPPPPEPPTAAAEDPSLVDITCPFVGTFYRSPSPDEPPFVSVGDTIKPGDVLCIVEAMKLMNEIEAEIAGTVVELLVDNGAPVEFGQKLFRVRKA